MIVVGVGDRWCHEADADPDIVAQLERVGADDEGVGVAREEGFAHL